MNYVNLAIGIILILGAIAAAIFTQGTALPIVLPVALFGLNYAGVKTE